MTVKNLPSKINKSDLDPHCNLVHVNVKHECDDCEGTGLGFEQDVCLECYGEGLVYSVHIDDLCSYTRAVCGDVKGSYVSKLGGDKSAYGFAMCASVVVLIALGLPSALLWYLG